MYSCAASYYCGNYVSFLDLALKVFFSGIINIVDVDIFSLKIFYESAKGWVSHIPPPPSLINSSVVSCHTFQDLKPTCKLVFWSQLPFNKPLGLLVLTDSFGRCHGHFNMASTLIPRFS